MVKVLIYSVVLLLYYQPCYCLETVPVIVVNTGGINIIGANVGNPFNKITNDIFSDMVKIFVSKASLVLIFVESQLSIEDITKKDSQGSPFKTYLEDMVQKKKLLYLPSVIDPYSTLTSLLPAYADNTYDLATANKSARQFRPSSHIYIKFEQAAPTAEKLRIHDLAMKSISRIAKSTVNGSVVTFYTGVKNPLVIAKRSTPSVKAIHEKSLFVASNRALFRLSVVHEHRVIKKSLPVEHIPLVKREHEVVSRSGGNGQLLTTLSFPGFDLRFDFTLGKKDWVLDYIVLLEADVEVGRANLGVGAPWRSSYYCAEALNIGNTRDGSTVRLNRYQWQPSRRSCELSKRGCENIGRSRFGEPISNIKDIGKQRKPCKGKITLDNAGNKNMEIDKTEQESIEEAGSGSKNTYYVLDSTTEINVNGEDKNQPFYQKKHQVNKNIGGSFYLEPNANDEEEKDISSQKKHPVNENKGTPDSSKGDQNANKEKRQDPFGQNKHPGNKNIHTPDYLITEQDANELVEKDPFGQKKHHVNENKGTPYSSKSDQNANKGKDPFGQNKHPGNKKIHAPGYLVTEQDVNEEGEKDPFGQKKHPVNENQGTPDISKSEQNSNKDKEKDPFGQKKHPGNKKKDQYLYEGIEKDPFGEKKQAGNKNKGSSQIKPHDNKNLNTAFDFNSYYKTNGDQGIETLPVNKILPSYNNMNDHNLGNKAIGEKESKTDPSGHQKHPSNNYISTEFNDKPVNLGGKGKSVDKNIPFHQNKVKPKQNPEDTPAVESSGQADPAVQAEPSSPTDPAIQAEPSSPTDPSDAPSIIDTTPDGSGSQIDDPKFGQTVDCGPYFNQEILSGLLVVFIILTMFFYGIEFMINLSANDRFDDFGDKTFSIAEEK